MERNKKYLITGGAGFIGSHLVGRFLEGGGKVSVYDNLSTGSRENLKNFFGNPGFEFIEADLLDIGALGKAMEGKDEVWHLGANTDIVKGTEETDRDFNNSVLATRNVLEAMRRTGPKKIFFSSSSTVYGDDPSRIFSEDDGPFFPISLYGAGKLACEGMISAYSHLFGIKGRIFRLANIVGGKMEHGVILRFIQQFGRDRKVLKIMGNGRQSKPFLLIDDCIAGMISVSECPDGGACSAYNLGGGSQTSLDRVASIVAEELEIKDFKIEYAGGDRGWPGDVPVYGLDVEKIKSTGWQPRHSSDEAVRIAAGRLVAELRQSENE